jgi:hypothetical protein
VRWILEGDEPVEAALLGADLEGLYTMNQLGDLAAYNQPEVTSPQTGLLTAESLGLRWVLEVEDIGRPRLFPRPDGGVIVALPRVLLGVSADGELRWREDLASAVQGWAGWGESQVFTSAGGDGGLWVVGNTGPVLLAGGISGLPVRGGEGGYLYDHQGIYHIQDAAPPELLYALPRAFPILGDLVVMPDGELVLAHMDRADRRLAALGPGGNLRWERSIAALPPGNLQLTVLEGSVYLSVVNMTSPSRQLYLYAVDHENGDLQHLFTGGTRSAGGDEVWVYPLEKGQLLIHLGGGSLVAFDPDLAKDAVSLE